MDYFSYLDAPTDRTHTECEKWDDRQNVFGRADVMPLWVADMDFRTVPEVIEALKARAAHGVFGYSMAVARDNEAIVHWEKTRHGLEISPDWILKSPGVVASILFALRALTAEHAGVVIQPPVYGPFEAMTKKAGRSVVLSPLQETAEGWQMDFAGLEKAFQAGARAMVLCNPHNPVGRMWTRAELTRLVKLCNQYDVLIIDDEIHGDFEMPGHRHVPLLTIAEADRVVTLISATKTFNLAALRMSSILVKNDALREKLQAYCDWAYVEQGNLFGALAQRTAYECGAEWLDALNQYLAGNRDFVVEYLRKSIPAIVPARLEGTYLMWLDCRALGLPHAELEKFMIEKAGIGFSGGAHFGHAGEGFMRMNIATQRRNLETALENLRKAVEAR